MYLDYLHAESSLFYKEVNPRLAKRPLVFNGRLATRGLISLVKQATGRYWQCFRLHKVASIYDIWNKSLMC